MGVREHKHHDLFTRVALLSSYLLNTHILLLLSSQLKLGGNEILDYCRVRQQIPRTLEKLGKPFEMCWFGETLFPLVYCAQISLN